jgi:hypothetical protein
VHSADPDGPGRQLGYGTVVGHPGRSTSSSNPPGGRPPHSSAQLRTANRGHHAGRARRRQRTHHPLGAPLEQQQHPTVTADPHWPARAALLDRIHRVHRAGGDVPALIDHVTRDQGLPTDNPARSLDYRLSDTMPALPRTDGQSYEPSTTAIPPPPPAWPSRPTLPPGITPPR